MDHGLGLIAVGLWLGVGELLVLLAERQMTVVVTDHDAYSSKYRLPHVLFHIEGIGTFGTLDISTLMSFSKHRNSKPSLLSIHPLKFGSRCMVIPVRYSIKGLSPPVRRHKLF